MKWKLRAQWMCLTEKFTTYRETLWAEDRTREMIWNVAQRGTKEENIKEINAMVDCLRRSTVCFKK